MVIPSVFIHTLLGTSNSDVQPPIQIYTLIVITEVVEEDAKTWKGRASQPRGTSQSEAPVQNSNKNYVKSVTQ